MLMANLNRQRFREIKLHVILVGAMGTIYKDYTDKPLADLKLDYHKIKKLTLKLNEHSIRHASALIKQSMHCNITQATTVKDWVLWQTTPLTHTNFFLIVSCWLSHHYQRSLFSFFYGEWFSLPA